MSQAGLVFFIFIGVYGALALGRWPLLALDRTGTALVGAILLYVLGVADRELVLDSIDFPTLAILFALMILSAQFAASGIYERIAARISAAHLPPRMILGLTVFVAGGLAAVLTNDVVVWAMTPVLITGLQARGLDPRPFVIALAAAANAGSAATVIGNPQNLIIAQAGGLDFWEFFVFCAPPALAALMVVYFVSATFWRDELAAQTVNMLPPAPPRTDRAALVKGALAAVAVLLLFSQPFDRTAGALIIASVLLISRKLTTRRMLGMVDWHLLILFASLFVVTGAMAETGLTDRLVEKLAELGVDPHQTSVLALLSLLGSNTVGNVPFDMAAIRALPDLDTAGLTALALFTTLAGNLLVVGSFANIIAIERASAQGVRIGFLDYARIGVPVTCISFTITYLWILFRT